MGKWLLGMLSLAAIVAAALFAAYALFHQPLVRDLEQARAEASLCAQERSAARTRASDLEALLDELRAESEGLAAQVREREDELARIQSTQDELVSELEEEIAEGQVRVERLRGQLRLDVVDEILFDSGETVLKPEGRAVLERVASVLKDSDRLIRVQGHTDNVPIRGKLAEAFPSNWELSSARAVGVVRFLQDVAGLEPERLSATALSEYRPRADNETDEGRQKNRRIEIVLTPNEGLPGASDQS